MWKLKQTSPFCWFWVHEIVCTQVEERTLIFPKRVESLKSSVLQNMQKCTYYFQGQNLYCHNNVRKKNLEILIGMEGISLRKSQISTYKIKCTREPQNFKRSYAWKVFSSLTLLSASSLELLIFLVVPDTWLLLQSR